MTSKERLFKTDLHCEACVEKISPHLNLIPGIQWKMDLDSPDKVLSVVGTDVSIDLLSQALARAGYKILREVPSTHEINIAQNPESVWTYFPLFAVLALVLVLSITLQLGGSEWNWNRWMRHFMGSFFLVFGALKLWNLKGFVEAYSTYDWLAQKLPFYGWIYPLIELSLGTAYFVNWKPLFTSVVTALVMTIGSFGVLKALINKKKFVCACLGTLFRVPMTRITLLEDLLMAGMAIVMIMARMRII